MSESDLQFVHRFEAATDASAPPLLLLHGTGGDENDLLPLGRLISPGSALLSVRGKVLEGGAPRFFRRLAEGVFDQKDLAFRTEELAAFVGAAAKRYGIDQDRLVAVGFSNGANIAASMLLRVPGALAGGVLIRAMVPFPAEQNPADLQGKRVLLLSGRQDPIVPLAQPEELAKMLRTAGADVELVWQPGGHGLIQRDVEQAREWLAKVRGGAATARA
jgi:phospholipase/carboxylesterase